MGATLGCAECHDHKFDPYTTKDFYSFQSFFADIKESGVVSRATKFEPYMILPTAYQRLIVAGAKTQMKKELSQ